jgi:hypothetical protein
LAAVVFVFLPAAWRGVAGRRLAAAFFGAAFFTVFFAAAFFAPTLRFAFTAAFFLPAARAPLVAERRAAGRAALRAPVRRGRRLAVLREEDEPFRAAREAPFRFAMVSAPLRLPVSGAGRLFDC